jgi:hypothetical protein
MPDPDNPLKMLFPQETTVSAVLKFDGVITLPVVALSTFFTEVVTGTLQDGLPLFRQVFANLAADAQADRSSKLSRILLSTSGVYDDSGNPVVSIQEEQQVITTEFFQNRVTQILTPNFDELLDVNKFKAATTLVINMLPKLVTEGTTILFGNMGKIIEIMAPIFVRAAMKAVEAGWEQFNPSLTINAVIQPKLFGMEFGDPVSKVDLLINKKGLSFAYEGSIIETYYKSLGLFAGP